MRCKCFFTHLFLTKFDGAERRAGSLGWSWERSWGRGGGGPSGGLLRISTSKERRRTTARKRTAMGILIQTELLVTAEELNPTNAQELLDQCGTGGPDSRLQTESHKRLTSQRHTCCRQQDSKTANTNEHTRVEHTLCLSHCEHINQFRL